MWADCVTAAVFTFSRCRSAVLRLSELRSIASLQHIRKPHDAIIVVFPTQAVSQCIGIYLLDVSICLGCGRFGIYLTATCNPYVSFQRDFGNHQKCVRDGSTRLPPRETHACLAQDSLPATLCYHSSENDSITVYCLSWLAFHFRLVVWDTLSPSPKKLARHRKPAI